MLFHLFMYSLAGFFLNPHPRICLLISEREEARRGAEKNIDVREKHLREKQRSAVSHTHPNWGPDRNLGICSDQGSNPKPSGEQDNTPHQMSHQPGPL